MNRFVLSTLALTAAVGCNPPQQQHWVVWETLHDDCPTIEAPSVGTRLETSTDAAGRFEAKYERWGVCTEPKADLRTCVFEQRYLTYPEPNQVELQFCRMEIAIDRNRLGPTMAFLDSLVPTEDQVVTAAYAQVLIAALPVGWPVYLGMIAVWMEDGIGLSADMMGY